MKKLRIKVFIGTINLLIVQSIEILPKNYKGNIKLGNQLDNYFVN